MKKILIALLALLLTVTLFVGCSGDENDGEVEPATKEEIEEALTEKNLDIKVSAAPYSDATFDEFVSFGWLNTNEFLSSAVQHLPVKSFSSLEELDKFKSFLDEALDFDGEATHDEVGSFNDAVAEYDDDFFDKNDLFLVYVGTNNSTERFGIKGVYADGGALWAEVYPTYSPEAVDAQMSCWFLTFCVPKNVTAACQTFDSVMVAAE